MAGKVDAIWVPIDNTIASASQQLSKQTKQLKTNLPKCDSHVEAGGLGSVVVDQHDLGVATGKMAAKILKGQKPADTPVEIFSQGKSVIKKSSDELALLFQNLS
ncbi:MAG: ABC transporter substrate binding protein [Streptococcus sp.]